MIRPWRRWRSRRRVLGRRRRGLADRAPVLAEQDRAVLAIARLHAAAQRDQVGVHVHDRPFGRLGSARVVLAIVEGDPAPSVLFTSVDLWPRKSTAHAVFLECPRDVGANAAERAERFAFSLWQFGNPDAIDSPVRAKGQEGGVAGVRQDPVCSVSQQ